MTHTREKEAAEAARKYTDRVPMLRGMVLSVQVKEAFLAGVAWAESRTQEPSQGERERGIFIEAFGEENLNTSWPTPLEAYSCQALQAEPQRIEYVPASILAAVRAEEREAIFKELEKAAQHFMEASGNYTQEQKVWAHDTCLLVSAFVAKGLFRIKAGGT